MDLVLCYNVCMIEKKIYPATTLRDFIRDNVADAKYEDFAAFVKDKFGCDLHKENPWGIWPKWELKSWLKAWHK